ncbi:MAG: OB-fold nucleic acid binding domain-containing protein [Candidatus Aenigmatarchaeota archaeon]
MEKKRLPAIKTRVKPIIDGKFVKQEGFEPSYVITNFGLKISRARILATVVDKFLSESGKFSSVTLDDGSGTIRAKAFGSLIFEDVSVGEIVDVIGKVKEYQEEIYILPETVSKVEPNWELLRELEIRKSEENLKKNKEIILEYQKQTSDLEELKNMMAAEFGIPAEVVEAIVQSQEKEEIVDDDTNKKAKDSVLKLIEELDKGDGCNYAELIEASGLAEDILDGIINDLLSEGICFEPRPGKIKKL